MGTLRRTALAPGIYDELLTRRSADQLARLAAHLTPERHLLTAKEDITAPLTALLGEAIATALADLNDRPLDALALAESLLHALHDRAPDLLRPDERELLPERLRALLPPPATAIERPRASLHASRLIVNAEGESMLDHLRSEFDTADRVDLLCAFLKLSGVEKLRAALERHCEARGRPLRVLTTTYMRASDPKAIERLAALPNCEVRVSYDESMTRLHAKAWVFHRESGYTTAFVGSSNLSHAAQTDGLEWNVRLTEPDQPAVIAQMLETFEQYWCDRHAFHPYDPSQRPRLLAALTSQPAGLAFHFDIEPKDFQRPILEELTRARALGRHRNLLVAATGTGKTVMAALDYRALRERGHADTLLFVAHRREILLQARATFRAVLRSDTFGELLVDGERPTIGRHLFASIDSLRTWDVSTYDLVILDEAHHAAAATWDDLLRRIRPRELLGLTGTPERSDGLAYADHFPPPWVGDLRVWNAIPHALVPFRYYVLDVDGVDLRDVAWVAGRYAPEALAGKLITAADLFVAKATAALADRIARPEALRALAFCANIAHARAVASGFQDRGFRTAVLTGETDRNTRAGTQSDLATGALQILCVVDLYNEGVDVPDVNTLFFFRPTESATVFLQQLGRGLRRAPTKDELVVFDLTGRQRAEFRFDRRLRGLLGNTPRELRDLVTHGFGRLPAGCHIAFDEKARAAILDQLRRAIPSKLPDIRALLREPAHAALSLAEFLAETDIDLDDIYRAKHSWHSLRESAALPVDPVADPEEAAALASVAKLLHVGGDERLDVWQGLLDGRWPAEERRRRCARMLFAVLYGNEPAADDAACLARIRRHRALQAELRALAPLLHRRNATLAPAERLHPDIPLALHARYLGVELSAAFDQRSVKGAFRDYYTGVEKTPGGDHDLLLVTLEKSAATREHLRYRDFPLDDRRFHWQSKARTRRDSPEGRRLLHPADHGCTPLLLVRERKHDPRGITMPFTYLGPVAPLTDHGERPITLEWALRHPMPPALLRAGRIAS